MKPQFNYLKLFTDKDLTALDDKIKVLMTGAGAPGGPVIIQALKKDNNINLHIADANPNSSGRYMSNDCPFYKLPIEK